MKVVQDYFPMFEKLNLQRLETSLLHIWYMQQSSCLP